MVVGELKHAKHEEQLIVGMQPLLSFFLHQDGTGLVQDHRKHS